MNWDSFIYFAIASLLFWAMGAAAAYKYRNKTIPALLTVAGLLIFALFIAGLWHSLERPPLRTMGETRLWYAFFLPVAGLLTYLRWNYKWILSFTTLLAAVFIVVNITKPDIHNKTLMPALQSPWVCTACHHLHVFLCHPGCRDTGRTLLSHQGEKNSATRPAGADDR